MFDHNNKTQKEVVPGSPIDLIGWDESPTAGDQFVAVKIKKKLRQKQKKTKINLKIMTIQIFQLNQECQI